MYKIASTDLKKLTTRYKKMLNLEQIKKKLYDRNLKEISRQTGINYGTVFNVATGKKKNPEYRTLKKLSDYLEQK